MLERFVSANDTYDAEAPFAEGASGLAHRATSARLGRRVFLKQLKLAGTRDWKTVELFERESKVLAGLDHPAIPRYLDHFQDEQRGSFVLVQELIDAPSLQDLLAQQRPLAPEQLRAIVEQALEVLDYLHTRVPPVLHRDISPKNFLFTGDKLFLVDFGAVKLSLRESTVMTSAGTFGYMAPEQILGQALPASDLYGLGMSVVALATGCDPTALPLDDRRGGVDMTQVLPKIPAALRPVVEALVRPGLADRVPTARDALALLRSPPPALAPAPAPAAPPAPRPSLARRRPVLTALLAATLGYCVYALFASTRPLPGQTGQLGGWTGGHTQLVSRLTHALVGDPDLFTTADRITAIAISPDNALVATSTDREVLLWDRATGELLRGLPGLPNGAEWLRFSPGGEALWGGAQYSAAWIRWNPADGKVEQSIDPQLLPDSPSGGTVLDVGVRGPRALSVLVQAPRDVTLTLYRADGESITQTRLAGSHADAALSGDGEIFAYQDIAPFRDNDDVGTVSVRRVATGEELGRFSLRYLQSFALGPDGRTVALFNNTAVALHRLGEAAPAPPVLLDASDYQTQHSFSADGARLAVAKDRHAFVLDVGARTILAHHEYERTALEWMSVTAIALSPDGTLLATGNHDELVRLWPAG